MGIYFPKLFCTKKCLSKHYGISQIYDEFLQFYPKSYSFFIHLFRTKYPKRIPNYKKQTIEQMLLFKTLFKTL